MDDHLRGVLQRLNKSGELRVLLDTLRDYADSTDKKIRVLLTNGMLRVDTAGEVNLLQGELRAALRLVQIWSVMAQAQPETAARHPV